MNGGSKAVILATLCATTILATPVRSQSAASTTAPAAESPPTDADEAALEAGFRNPPESARPRVWWHWLSGNVAKPGITLDMEWMKAMGIGGLQMFDGDMGAPQIVAHRVAALSPEWLDDVRFAAAEADRLGLEFGMAAAPGWSETGGPWVTPQAAMKKIVWSETAVRGGRRFAGMLTQPPGNPGPFQDKPKSGPELGGAVKIPDFYRDIAVLAYPTPAGDVSLASLKPVVTISEGGGSTGTGDPALLIDGRLDKSVSLPMPQPGAPAWVRFDFAAAATIRGLTYAGPLPGRFSPGGDGAIEASDDGTTWRTIAALPGAAQSPAPERTIAFAPTIARHFRVVFRSVPAGFFGPATLDLAELAPIPGGRVQAFEDKAGFGVLAEADTLATPAALANMAVAKSDVIDLTGRMGADGRLDWIAPKGNWTVLRMGWSPTGATNHPATPEVTGLEVDKLDAGHVRAHLDAYLTPVIAKLGPLVGAKGLRYLLTDSWEAGVQNWTDAMVAEFTRRRGYDPMPFLPVLAGRIVDSPAASDRFLWDYRRTIADLVAANHYGTITAYAKEHGLGYYGEAVGASWPTIADGMQAKSLTDIPMGEYWAIPFGGVPAAFHGVPSNEFPADIVETASTAHVYGKPLVAAEALTSSLPQYSASPWSLKWVADKYMAMGVNRHVIHTSPHQPGVGKVPGLTLGPFSQAFTRNETWADMAKPWIDYLSRSSFLLQQGRPVADILYFYGEGAPSGVPYREAQRPAVPDGYTADYINAEALLSLVSVEGGQLVTKGGARYRALVLPDTLTQMTAPLAAKLRDLVAAGAILVGPKPQASPSRTSQDADVAEIVDALWGGTDGRLTTAAAYGKGQVHWGAPLGDVLSGAGVAPDFRYNRSRTDTDLVFAHRKIGEGDIYFVSNQTGAKQSVNARFRVAGKAARLWKADGGTMMPLSYAIADGITTVPMTLDPYEAVFVVFTTPASGDRVETPPVVERTLLTLTGPWDVAFEPGRGAPATHRFAALTAWDKDADPGIRYFSGKATYTKTITVPAARGRMLIDLGIVHELARVRVNGREAGIAWKPPYRVDITDAVRPGRNIVTVEVANLWRNRLIGDAQPGVTTKHAFTSQPAGDGPFGNLGGPVKVDSPLLPSGLLGPVTLVSQGR